MVIKRYSSTELLRFWLLGVLLFISVPLIHAKNLQPAITTPIQPEQLVNYDNYPAAVKNLISKAVTLSKQHLTYLYGSANPNNKGMDCSGTMYFLLRSLGVATVPRSSDEMYQWVKAEGKFYAVKDQNFNSLDFANLNPGDLLFWTGTYSTARANKISHVMVYLGKDQMGKPLMFGSSDGRTYEGKKMWGVSLFDFNLPRPGSRARFIGYSCIPGLTCGP